MKILRWIGIATAASVFGLAAIVAIAPSIISTSWGRGVCLNAASRFCPGSIELKSLSVGWLSGIDLQGLRVKDCQGRDWVTCSRISLEKPLLSLLFSQKDIGAITVVSPSMYCYASSKSSSLKPAKESCLEEKSEKHKSHSPVVSEKQSQKEVRSVPMATPDVKGSITISDAQCIAVVDDRVVGSLAHGNVFVDLDLLHATKGTIDGDLTNTSSKSTPLSLTFSLDGATQLSQMKGAFSFSCNKVPVDLLKALTQSVHPDIAEFLKESFGSTVSYSVSATLSGPAIVVHSALTSDNVCSDINVKIEDGTCVVDRGDLVTGTISPALFHLLTHDHLLDGRSLSLLSPTTCSIENNSPLSIQLSPLRLRTPMDLHCSTKTPCTFSVGHSQLPITVSIDSSLQGSPETPTANVLVTASSAADTATLHLTAAATQQDAGYFLTSSVNLNGKWPSFAEEITGLPCSSLVGPDLTSAIRVEGPFQAINDFSLQGEATVASAHIKKRAVFSCTPKLFSVSHASLEAFIPTGIIEKYGATPHFSNPLGSAHLQSTVNGFSIPLEKFSPVFTKMAVDAITTIEVPTLFLQPNGEMTGALDSSTITCKKSEQSPIASFDVKAKASVTSKGIPLIASVIDKEGLTCQLAGTYNFEKPALSIAKVNLSAARLSAHIQDFALSFNSGILATLSSPATVQLVIDKEAIAALPSNSMCSIARPAELMLTVQPFSLSQKDGAWQGTAISSEIRCENIQLSGKKSFGPYSLSIPLSFDMNHHTISAKPAITSGAESLLKAAATVQLPEQSDIPFIEALSAECSVEIQKLPTALLEALLQKPLTVLIGDELSSKLSCTFNGLHAKGNCVSVASSGLFWKAAVDLSCDDLQLSTGRSGALDIETTISPQCFESIQSMAGQPGGVKIVEPFSLHMSVPTCSMNLSPLFSKTTATFWELLGGATISTKISTSAIHLQQHGTPIGRLPPITATVDLQGTNSLKFSIDGPAGLDSGDMTISLKGSLDNAWNKEGLTLPTSHLRTTVDVNRFPTRVLDLVAPEKGALMEKAIGETLHVAGTVSVDNMQSGVVLADLNAKNCTAHVDGTIQHGVLTLNNPAMASLIVTKEAGALLLKDVHPLLATAVNSEKPMKLTIDPHGVSIPLSPFSITKITLPKVTVDVGKIVVKNGGALKVILALLGMGHAANSEDLPVWLTPLYLRVQGGVITCQRADALVADKLHMITWGNVDLGQEQINMVVAIPQETLAAIRLKITSPTPERGLQIPITGPLSNPKIDTSKATARLAGAGILNNSNDKRLQIFGGLLQAAAASMGEPDQPIPAPTTQPFPWER